MDMTPPKGSQLHLPRKSNRPATGVAIKAAKNRSFLVLIIGVDIQAKTGLVHGDRVALAQIPGGKGAGNPWFLVKAEDGFRLYHDGASPTLRATITGMHLPNGDAVATCSKRGIWFMPGDLQLK